MTTPARIAFMGSDPIALPLLEYLIEGDPAETEFVGVFTQPDRPTGRGMKVVPNAIKQWALEHKLPVRQPEKCGADDEQWLRDSQVDLLLVMAYGQLLRRSLIAIPPRGVINFHASLLPKLRGASPIHTAIATGEKTTGISLMRIVPQLDAGPVLDAEHVPVSLEAQAPDIIDAMAAAGVPLIARNLETLCRGQPVFKPQPESAVTYCRRILKEDAALDWTRPAQALHDHVRAFQPWPGAILDLGHNRLKIGRTRPGPDLGRTPGTIVIEGARAFVQCGDGALELLDLQRPGGRMLPTDAFLKGFPVSPETVAISHPMAPLVADRPFAWK